MESNACTGYYCNATCKGVSSFWRDDCYYAVDILAMMIPNALVIKLYRVMHNYSLLSRASCLV